MYTVTNPLLLLPTIFNCAIYVGNWLCSMPGCDKKCWVKDNGGVHDYCSKSHAEEHQRIKSSLKPMKKKSSNGSPGSVSSTYPTASGMAVLAITHNMLDYFSYRG